MAEQSSFAAAGYTVDLVYPSPFVFGQTPLQMQWAAGCAGAPRGPLTEPFRYCDLGCGDGTNLCLLAACYPRAEFVGIDLSAAHIDLARGRAGRAGLANVSFIHASFADVEARNLPAFDYVAAVGVYSWLAPALQRSLLQFARERLRPGGLVGIHYSCLPGSAVSDPLFHYLRLLAGPQPGNSAARFAAACAALRELSPVARFFPANPEALELLRRFESHSPAFVAHDVLNRGLHSLYSSELHAMLAAERLEYLGSADVLPDYPELLLTGAAYAVYQKLTDGADVPFRESVRDFMQNSAVRFDVFRRAGEPTVAPGERLRALGDLYLQRAGDTRDLEARRRWSAGCAVDLTSPVCAAVLDLAAAPAMTLGAALASPELKAFAAASVERAVEHLFALGFLNVLVTPPVGVGAAEPEAGSKRRYRLTSALNAERLRETLASPADEGLASPVLGSPLLVPAAARVRLMALLGGDITPAWQASGGGATGTLEQFRRQVDAGMPQLLTDAVPRLLRLGILEAER
jgi:SAM-dependent methyltransferase